ncbi:polysaccharide biosynthesis protein [delta proteobacterium NaphS2]|nr:polysaccharide biosynthesis protein [delta proteobacterium NaphS2]
MFTLRRFTRVSTLYAVGNTAQRGVAFLLIPIYTAALKVSEYGALETIQVTFQILLILINMGLSNAFLRYFSEGKSKAEKMMMARTSFVLVLVSSLGILLLLITFAQIIISTVFKGTISINILLLVFLWAVGGALNQQMFAYYRAREEAKQYIFITVGVAVILLCLNIYFVRFLDMGILGVILGNLITIWSLNIYLLVRLFRDGISISRKWAGRLIRFGVPLIWSMAGWMSMNSADRYFLAYYHGLSEVGVYGLGYKVGIIVQMLIVMPFQLAWGPFLFNSFNESEDNANDTYSRVFTYLLFAFSMMALTVFMFSAELVSFLGNNKFSQSVDVVPYVLVAYLFNGIYYWSGAFLHLTKKTGLLGRIVAGMAGLNLLLNWILIPTWGWRGAAFATVISLSGAGMISLYFSQRLYRVHLQYHRLTKLVIATSAIIAAYSFVPRASGFLSVLVRGLFILSLPALLQLFHFFSFSEINTLKSFAAFVKKKFLPKRVW